MEHHITINAPNGVKIEITSIPPTWSREDTFEFLSNLFLNLGKNTHGK